MSNTIGISMAGISQMGVSTQSVRDQLIKQLDFGQTQLSQLETQISSGHQYQLPSENPGAALQVTGIQSLLERKDQLKANISTNQGYLTQTDSALSSVSGILTSVQSSALGAVGSTATAAQRQAVIQQIDQAVQEMITLGNQQFNGRQLFGGADTGATPFAMDAAGNVVYSGSSAPTQSYVDLNQLFNTSITGDQAFGAMSQPIQGTALTTALSANTPLSVLNGGKGVSPGSIAISVGHNTTVVDLRSATTLGDVALLIHQHPLAGQTVDVNVTPTGLALSFDSDPTASLSVNEVNGNTTAADLGILNPNGAVPAPAANLNAAITPTTALGDLFGTRAQANIHFGQANSDIVLQANSTGAAASDGTLLNNVNVVIDSAAPSAGQESATFDPGTPVSPGTLTIHMSTSSVSASRADQIIAAINAVPGLPFTASLDPADQNGGAESPITNVPAAPITTSGGGGTTLDPSGLQIASGGKTYTVSLAGDKTVEDLLSSINNSGAGLDAEINATKTGIDVRSRVSGADFAIGENGGTTAAQLGLRTFTTATALSQLNYGGGAGVNTVTPGGTDFTVSDTINNIPVQASVSIAGNSTIADVLQNIKAAVDAAAQAAGAIPPGTSSTFVAQLVGTGNGIELSDSNPSDGPIVVTADSQSTAAADLGLVPTGQASATSTNSGGTAVLTGSDTNPQETNGSFNALLKLRAALQSNDNVAIQRAMGLLSTSMQNLGSTRNELGSQEQALSSISTQIDSEELTLKSTMSTNYDTDMAATISQYSAAQISYQATLQITANLLKVTLLNYI